MEIPQWKVFSSTEIQTRDLPTQILFCFATSPSFLDLAVLILMDPRGWLLIFCFGGMSKLISTEWSHF